MLVQLILAFLALSSPNANDVPALAQAALAGDESAVHKLRALGPSGLDALVKLRRELSSVPPLFVGPVTPEVLKWEALVDKVARQKYASASGLYWYTELEAAKAAAKAAGKPILSLRLLGDLDEDFSCANSRFFRTILYPDPAIAAALHDGWVLHWESVRKVPRIEIDFGDGRKLTRTITGNSLHYAMTADGVVTEVMPGMVGPEAFRAWIDDAAAFTARVQSLPAAQRPAAIASHFKVDFDQRLAAWQAALKRIGIKAPRDLASLRKATTDDVIERLAEGRRIVISDEANRLVQPMMGKTRGVGGLLLAPSAMRIAITKSAVEMPILAQLSPVEGNLAKDEVKNLFEMKSQLADLALGSDLGNPDAVPALTTSIYANAFLTPLDDPWMGLAPADVFTGLPPALEKTETAAN